MSQGIPTRYRYIFAYNYNKKPVEKVFYAESKKDAIKDFEKTTGLKVDSSYLITRRPF